MIRSDGSRLRRHRRVNREGSPMLTEHTMLSEIEERCDAIEEAYEFMLGYAGKGLPSDEGTQIRYYLQRAAGAITGLAKSFSEVVEKQRIEPTEKYEAFLT